MPKQLKPKILTAFSDGYTRHQFFRDLISGIIVGIVALPLAIAFAIASGVKPEQGLYTAVVAGFVIALLGGSRVQVSGPTGAFIVVVAGIVNQYGYDGLAVSTLIAGIILVLMGLFGFGMLLKFVPYPLTIGFTSGIALIIFSSQVKDFFGLQISNMPVDFLSKWQAILMNFYTINIYSTITAFIALFIVVLSPKINSKIPGSLIAIVSTTLLVYYFSLPVETIGSRFGSVPSSIPFPKIPVFDLSRIKELIRPAITIALLGGIESLLSAVVADGMLGTRHRSNMELVAQGIGNIISPIFQGIPATGAIARTATNIKCGGRTPLAALTHAVVLFLIMIFFGKLAAMIPIPSLAAILVFVAYNMSEWHAFIRGLSYPKSDVIVLLVTFLLTVLVDLTVAIEAGVVLAAFLFVKRMEETAGVSAISAEILNTISNNNTDSETRDFTRTDIPDGVEVFEVFGPIFFSAVDRFTNSISRFERTPKVLILYMTKVGVIDGTGLRAIQILKERLIHSNCTLMIAGAGGETLKAIKKAAIISETHIFSKLQEALVFAKAMADKKN